MGLWKKWVAIRTEGGSRVDLIDRLEAYFKRNGIKSKISIETSSLKKIHVLEKDENRARELMAEFDAEQ